MPSPRRARPEPLDIPTRDPSSRDSENSANTPPRDITTVLDVDVQGASSEKKGKPELKRRKSVVDVPETGVGMRFPRVDDFVRSNKFESIVGMAILLNCVTIGVEVDAMVKGQSAEFRLLSDFAEHVFTAFFLTEFLLRFFFLGWRIYFPCCTGGVVSRADACWNLADLFFVWGTGVAMAWIAPLLGFDVGRLRIFIVMRAVRLMRLVRVVRKMPEFSEVYLLVRGFADSMRTLFWTILVIFGITYIFAIFGIVLISVSIMEEYDGALLDEDAAVIDMVTLEMLVESCGSLDRWMYTLMQVLTLDSWSGISRPMEKVVPNSWIFMYLYIALVAIVFMNLVTAVIVENAIENSKADEEAQLVIKEEENRKLFKTFTQLFHVMDEDGDGTLTAQEFDNAFATPELERKLKLLDFKRDECIELFGLLDEGDGSLTLEEFFYGLQQMKGEASAKEVFILQKYVDRIWNFLLQSSQEADEDSQALYKALGCMASRKSREGSILSRSKEESRRLSEQRRKSSEMLMAISPTTNSQMEFSDGASVPSAPMPVTQLSGHIKDLIGHIDGVSQSISSQIQKLSERVKSVEESSSKTQQSVQQLLSGATPLEPKLKDNRGQPLGGCCAMDR
eukprot:TRINITY_DN33762_c0_g1_i1.p1 TRINITY_DN33762_c0_g1~~TRINITY_DN33762_c0_g1_i1.p1  ORF type:complete len:621 (-),score=129.20 TRINITY_DN33762_c0_g1_i1:177-2039(-)